MKKEFRLQGLPRRLDAWLAAENPGLSREFIKRLIATGAVSLNGEAASDPSRTAQPGDVAGMEMPGPDAAAPRLRDLVIFENEGLLAIDKPSGLAAHPNDDNWMRHPEALRLGEPTVVSLVLEHMPELVSLERLGLIHRLDRDTSGVMLIAKTAETQKKLRSQFEERTVSKVYTCAVCGFPPEPEGTIDAPIGRPSGAKKLGVWRYGREAVTEFSTLEKAPAHSLLEIRPRTGRTNQIRIHLAFIGCPIAGDKVYGGGPASRLMLHASELSFVLPGGRKKKISAKPPAEFTAQWKLFRKPSKGI